MIEYTQEFIYTSNFMQITCKITFYYFYDSTNNNKKHLQY